MTRRNSFLLLWLGMVSQAMFDGETASADCVPVINPANWHSYCLMDQSNWTDAVAAAGMLGGHLVTINDAAEDAWVFNTFKQPGQYGLWIGLNDKDDEAGNDGARFVWSSRDTASYRNFAASQPDDHAGIEDYGMIFVEENGSDARAGSWNDFRNVAFEHTTSGGRLHGVAEFGGVATAKVRWSQNGHAYQVVGAHAYISWETASDAAAAAGGHLATITSADENAFVSTLLDRPEFWSAGHVNSHGPYLGGVNDNGNWRWVTDEPWEYTNWQSGQPDSDGAEPYLNFMQWGDNNRSDRWNDISFNDHVRAFVIEYKPNLGDTNFDGQVDLEDLNAVRNHFGEGQLDGPRVAGDAYPFDGVVDLGDLNLVRNHFGAGAEGFATPEPAAASLAGAGIGLLLFAFLLGHRRYA